MEHYIETRIAHQLDRIEAKVDGHTEQLIKLRTHWIWTRGIVGAGLLLLAAWIGRK